MEIWSLGTLVSVAPVVVGVMEGMLLFVSFAQFPYWKSLPPDQFRKEFTASGPLIARLLIPLSTGATFPVVIAAILLRGTAPFVPELVAAISISVADSAHLLTIKPTNALVGKDALTPAQITALLGQSAMVANLRLVLGLVAVVCSVTAVLLFGSR